MVLTIRLHPSTPQTNKLSLASSSPKPNTTDAEPNLNSAFEGYGISQISNHDDYKGWGMNVFDGQYYDSQQYTNETDEFHPDSPSRNMFQLYYPTESNSGGILPDEKNTGRHNVVEVGLNPQMLFQDYSYDPSQEDDDIWEEIRQSGFNLEDSTDDEQENRVDRQVGKRKSGGIENNTLVEPSLQRRNLRSLFDKLAILRELDIPGTSIRSLAKRRKCQPKQIQQWCLKREAIEKTPGKVHKKTLHKGARSKVSEA
ncbi:hypothetical protein HDU99_000533, partial [Rhizoclosmatium hyalinum]